MDSERHPRALPAQARIVPDAEIPCIWMQAGVLTCWICDRELRCESCPLDAALRHDALRAITPPRRSAPEAEAVAAGAAAPAPAGASRAVPAVGVRAGREAPDAGTDPTAIEGFCGGELAPLDPLARFAPTHTWARDDGPGGTRIGIDPFAARIVGRLRCVVLPTLGTRVQRGHPCAWLDQRGGTLTLLAPMTGLVCERNEALAARAEFELRDPQQTDWLLCLRPLRGRAEWDALVPAADFAPHMQADFAEWRRTLEREVAGFAPDVGRTAADGSIRVRDLAGLLGDPRVHRLAASFLGSGRNTDRTRRGG
jgi:glycine cleavage system H protein